MPLEIYIPTGTLAEYVNMLWAWPDYIVNHAQEYILPQGNLEITIDLTDHPFRVWYPDGTEQHIRGPMVAGGRSEPFRIGTDRPQSLLAVWFKPGAAWPFFSVPADELHNQHLSLDTLWGPQAVKLYDQLLHAPTTADRLHILEQALYARLQAAAPRHHAVDYALHVFNAAPGHVEINTVVDQLGLSATRFIKVFRDAVGMTPKRYTRLIRFQAALMHITATSQPDWTDIALTCGYFDQSHFINDFQRFAGMRPTQYAPQDPDHRLNLPVLELEKETP